MNRSNRIYDTLAKSHEIKIKSRLASFNLLFYTIYAKAD